MENVFSELKGRQVKVLFSDAGRTKVVTGTLNEVKDTYIVVDEMVIGLGLNFISCKPQE